MSETTETKRRILNTAFRLFHEQGYNATSISTILREAEINSGSLYHFFPSKEALLCGVLEFALPSGKDLNSVSISYTAKKPAFKPVSGQIAVELPQTELLVHWLDWELRTRI